MKKFRPHQDNRTSSPLKQVVPVSSGDAPVPAVHTVPVHPRSPVWVSGGAYSKQTPSGGKPKPIPIPPSPVEKATRKRGSTAVTPHHGQELWDNGMNSCWLTSILAAFSLMRSRIGVHFPPNEQFTPVFQLVLDSLMPWLPGSSCAIAYVDSGAVAFASRNSRREDLIISWCASWLGRKGLNGEFVGIQTAMRAFTTQTPEATPVGGTPMAPPTTDQVEATRELLLQKRIVTSKCNRCFHTKESERDFGIIAVFSEQAGGPDFTQIVQREVWGTPYTRRQNNKCKKVVPTESPYEKGKFLQGQCNGTLTRTMDSSPPMILYLSLHGVEQYADPTCPYTLTLTFTGVQVSYCVSAVIQGTMWNKRTKRNTHFRSWLHDGVHWWLYDSLVAPYMTVFQADDTIPRALSKHTSVVFYIREDAVDKAFLSNMKKYKNKLNSPPPDRKSVV